MPVSQVIWVNSWCKLICVNKKNLHNCRKTYKLNSNPHSLVSHPVSIMYKVLMCKKHEKESNFLKNIFLWLCWDSCPRSLSFRQSRPNLWQNAANYSTIKHSGQDLLKYMYWSTFPQFPALYFIIAVTAPMFTFRKCWKTSRHFEPFWYTPKFC